MEEESEEKKEEEDGCCLCGDVGFSDRLLRCSCSRLQHTYCSRVYPNINMSSWQCEWCLYKHSKYQQKQQQQHHSTVTNASLKKRQRDKGEVQVFIHDRNKTVTSKKQRRQQQNESSSSMPSVRTCHRNQLRKPSVVSRRYKLLADVLC